MADVQAQDATGPSPAIVDLAGGDDTSVSGLVSSLTNLDRQKVTSDKNLESQFNADAARDKAARETAFKADGVAASELPKPWDADKEHKKWESNPIEGFGSAGGLFAMVASAFTKAPMENAINGMAEAINSVKEGNEAGYARAYDAFKTNVKLADQRFKTQHELYADALAMGTADAAASSAKFHNAATRFGDTQMLMLAEHGMIKEIYELQTSRAQAQEQMMKAADAIDLHTVQKAAVDSIKRNPPKTDDPVADKMMLAAQIQRIYDGGGKYGTAEQEAVGSYMQKAIRENQSADAIADGLAEIHQKFSAKAPNIEGYQAARQSWIDQHPGETIPADEDAKLLQQFGLTPRGAAGAAGHSESSQARKTRAIEEIVAKHKADGKPISMVEAEAEYNRTVATPSGNRIDDLRGKIDQSDNIIEGSKKQLDFLRSFKGGAGLMGKIMRGEEIASNIVGAGNQSDRVAFRRRVLELQEIVPRIMTDSSGRPLASAQKKVDSIVAGLEAGDTSANTIRAYEDLVAEIEKRKEDYRGRIGTGYNPEAKSSGATPGAPDKKPADTNWLDAYPVKQ